MRRLKNRHPNSSKAPSGAFFYGIFCERDLRAERWETKKTARAVVRRLLPRRSNSIRTGLATCPSGCLGWRLWISGSSRCFRRSFRIETFARRFLSRSHPTPSAAPEGAANKNKLTHYPDVNRVSYSPVFTGYSQMWICSTARESEAAFVHSYFLP